MELRRYWFVLARWAWLIALATLLAAGTSYVVSRASMPIYSATTLILVDQAQNPMTPDYNSVLTSERLTSTYGRLIKTRPVLTTAIKTLGLTMPPEDLARIVNVVAIRDTQLLALTVENSSPTRARDLANTLAQVFIDRNRKERIGRGASAGAVLRQQISNVEAQMNDTPPTVTVIAPSAPLGTTPTPSPASVVDPAISPPVRLRIAKIGVDVPVVVADGSDLPRFKGVGWYLGTGYPGFHGNMVLFGHLNGLYETFGRLHELAPGDTILVDTLGGKPYRYRVVETKVVPQTAVDVLAPSRDEQITLLTCTGTFFPLTRDYSDRLVVVGRRNR